MRRPQEQAFGALGFSQYEPFYRIFTRTLFDDLCLSVSEIVRLTGLTEQQIDMIISHRLQEAPLSIALQLSATLNLPIEVWTGQASALPQELTPSALGVAAAYDRAKKKPKSLVRLALDLDVSKCIL